MYLIFNKYNTCRSLFVLQLRDLKTQRLAIPVSTKITNTQTHIHTDTETHTHTHTHSRTHYYVVHIENKQQ